MRKTFCVVSHTHWDREWYLPFEQLRMRLVDLMDNLLVVLDSYPDYVFHLDAQTIVLEDYLAIKPGKRATLEEHIRNGNLMVGPWYVQNDFYLSSGEATIRNLLIGSRLAEEAGKCSWVGYAPDQFGLISQLPQILNGFGIDSCIFGRGYHLFDTEGGLKPRKAHSEFTWKGRDGSEVLAIHMPFWYNNAQRFSGDIDRTMRLLEHIESSFEGVALTPYLLLMNGVDHLEAQEDLLPILAEANERLAGTKVVQQRTMRQYVDDVRTYIAGHPGVREQLEDYTGELRNGVDYAILQGTLSSRVYLKALNVRAQNLIECNVEPLWSLIHAVTGAAAGKYPSDYMQYIWKLLIQNHAHDSICGCSVDAVNDHMEDRFKLIAENGQELLRRGLEFVTSHVTRAGLESSDYLITLFNTLETQRSCVAEMVLQFPVSEAVRSFQITDAANLEVPYAITDVRRESRGLHSPINLPGSLEVDSFTVQIYVGKLEGLGYKALMVRPSGASPAARNGEGKGTRQGVLENARLRVEVGSGGRIDLLYKETGKVYEDIFRLEDMADCGDSYVYGRFDDDVAISSACWKPEVTCVSENDLETIYSLVYALPLPESFDAASGRRSTKCVENRVEVLLGLKKGSDWLDVNLNIENRSKDHRLRALFRTGMETDYTHASVPFDVVRRDRRDVMNGIKNGTQPNSGFVDIGGAGEGVAILNEGLFEYEHLLDGEGTVALTLLRANALIHKDAEGKAADPAWAVPGNQCLRTIRLRAAICPHKGDYVDAQLAARAREFQNPVVGFYQPAEARKFTGGRPAVQDSAIGEIFYREDPFASLVLPMEGKLAGMAGRGVVLSALKKSENDDGLIVRVCNLADQESDFEWTFFRPITKAWRVDMRERPLDEIVTDGACVRAVLRPKEIFTFRVE